MNTSINSTPYRFDMDQVTSADGAQIGYRRIGQGPALVILTGGLRASQHYQRLVLALARDFSVYVYDRRGRNASGDPGPEYSIATEIADLAAMLKHSGASMVFGHSLGGVLALEAAAAGLPISKMVLYEPAVSINGSLSLDWLPDFHAAMRKSDFATAMAVTIRGLQLNWMSNVPLWLLRPIFNLMLGSGEGEEIVELLRTMTHESTLLPDLDDRYTAYDAIQAQTLVLGGANSPSFLRDVLPALDAVLPHGQTRTLAGMDHTAPEEPGAYVIAEVAKNFLKPDTIGESMASFHTVEAVA